MGWSRLGDPGPCPVDDTPHTACTPESVAARSSLIVAVRVPFVLQRARAKDVAPITPAVEFTTGTYRRHLHGHAALAKKQKP